jgi:hypothetical protein
MVMIKNAALAIAFVFIILALYFAGHGPAHVPAPPTH